MSTGVVLQNPKHNISQWPMIATYSRIAFAPFMFIVLIDWKWSGIVAAVLFALASITDWLDGYLARRLNATSNMGKLMDPIADKILVTIALIILLDMQRIDPFMVVLLLCRDTYIGGLRSVAATNQVIIDAKPFGKWKTALQMTAIPCIFIFDPIFNLPIYDIGYGLLWVSVLLSVLSAFQYAWEYYSKRSA
jgi:CDP-diacylglycerol--glycerol-3-phosphate 3-phosphatidyltransferase